MSTPTTNSRLMPHGGMLIRRELSCLLRKKYFLEITLFYCCLPRISVGVKHLKLPGMGPKQLHLIHFQKREFSAILSYRN